MPVQDAVMEPVYTELEDPYTLPEEIESVEDWALGGDRDIEVEDEGIWLEGDAGFSWEDTRWERWIWEEENGMGEDEYEDYDEEHDPVEEDMDKEEEEIWE